MRTPPFSLRQAVLIAAMLFLQPFGRSAALAQAASQSVRFVAEPFAPAPEPVVAAAPEPPPVVNAVETPAIDAPSFTLARLAGDSSKLDLGLDLEGNLGEGHAGSARSERHEEHVLSEDHRNTMCETGQWRGRVCRVSWWRVLLESVEFLAWQHGGNIALDTDTRLQLTHGDFWDKYVYCVEHYRWWRWKDDDPFGVDYIGHPMMGSYSSFIYEQNDPKQRALVFSNNHHYWYGRLRAMAYSAAYSAQWKVGFASEASVGNTGIGYYVRPRDGVWTNETGMQDFFITPVGGLAWNVMEDVVDRYVLRPIFAARKNKWLQVGVSVLNPTRSGANLFRFRAVYYRDHDEATDRPR